MGEGSLEKDILEQSDLYKELGLDEINFDDLDAVLEGIESHEAESGMEKKLPEIKKILRRIYAELGLKAQIK